MKRPSVTDIAIDSVPAPGTDALSSEEATDYEGAQRALEHEQMRLANENLKQDIELRKKWISRTFGFTAANIAAVFLVVVVNGAVDGMQIENSVLIALITGVAVESIGIVAIVTKYLFPS